MIKYMLADYGFVAIDKLDGSRTFADAKDIFRDIDTNFQSWGLNTKYPGTLKMRAHVYSLTLDSSTKRMFETISSNLNELVLTPHQVIWLCTHRPDILAKKEGNTFFLLESYGRFFVVYITVTSGGSLWLRVTRFSMLNPEIWNGRNGHRIVVKESA
ncbi:MAG: hypothetical protein WCO21_01530 [bacterium]